jgi:hypothetical protein
MAREYSRECYTQLALWGSQSCNTFIQSTIHSQIQIEDPCPFQDTMCATPAITIDTGFIDSHQHLGMNTAQQNRIQFRKLMSCAIIPADRDYSTGWTKKSAIPTF